MLDMVISHDTSILSYIIKVCSRACLEKALEKLTPNSTAFNSLTGFGVSDLTGFGVWLSSGFATKLKETMRNPSAICEPHGFREDNFLRNASVFGE